jgi:hypothetical protein
MIFLFSYIKHLTRLFNEFPLSNELNNFTGFLWPPKVIFWCSGFGEWTIRSNCYVFFLYGWQIIRTNGYFPSHPISKLSWFYLLEILCLCSLLSLSTIIPFQIASTSQNLFSGFLSDFWQEIFYFRGECNKDGNNTNEYTLTECLLYTWNSWAPHMLRTTLRASCNYSPQLTPEWLSSLSNH